MTTRMQIHHLVDQAVTVGAAGVELFRYVYRPDTPVYESPKPYLHPVRTIGGDLVSLFRPHDHVWHKGIAWSLPVVGGHNFWGGPSYVAGRGYVDLDDNGSASHVALTALTADDERAVLAHRLDWRSQAGDPVIDEHRSLTATVLDDTAWALLFDTTMTNVSGQPLVYGSPTTNGRPNAGYGGLFWRGPRSFTGGSVVAPGGVGGDELRGCRAPWLAFQGRHDGTARWSTVVMVDGEHNPHHPPQWFTRSEMFACLCPAPFFSRELAQPAGAHLRFRYAVIVADGHPDVDGVAALAERGGRLLAQPAPQAPAGAVAG